MGEQPNPRTFPAPQDDEPTSAKHPVRYEFWGGPACYPRRNFFLSFWAIEAHTHPLTENFRCFLPALGMPCQFQLKRLMPARLPYKAEHHRGQFWFPLRFWRRPIWTSPSSGPNISRVRDSRQPKGRVSHGWFPQRLAPISFWSLRGLSYTSDGQCQL